jgi:hypothetical protein
MIWQDVYTRGLDVNKYVVELRRNNNEIIDLRRRTMRGQNIGSPNVEGVRPTHEHLGSRMELDSGSSNAMDMGPADAEWLIRNAQELNGESTRSDFLRNYRLCPDV